MKKFEINPEIKIFRFLTILGISVLAWIFLKPVPGLSEKALHMLIIFVASMVGIMLEVCHPVAFLLITMLVANLTGTIEVKESFSGFSNIVPWLLFLVLSLTTAITKTTLGMRLAYIFMRFFGKGITGLSYSIIMTEFFVAPILPSNTARAASVGYPLVTSLAKYISSKIKGVSEQAIGGYLTLLYSSSNAVCSGIFLTAMISNAIIIEAMQDVGIQTTWLSWFKYAIVPGALILAIIPFIVRIFCHPKTTELGNIQEQAQRNYNELGALTNDEKFIIATFMLMLLMWIFAEIIHVPVLVTTLLGVCVFYVRDSISMKTILSNNGAFSSVIMLAILISYVNCLSSFGAIQWFTSIVSNLISGCSVKISFVILSVIYFLTHYFFTGEGSRIIALYMTFLGIGISLGIDKVTVAMTFALFSAMSSVLTNYSGPVAIMMFSSGYVPSKKWFSCGIVTAVAILAMCISVAFVRI